jgi:hypothetical protein
VVLLLLAVASCSRPESKNSRQVATAGRQTPAASTPAGSNSNVSAPSDLSSPESAGNVEYFENDATNRIGKGSTLERAKRRLRPVENPNASPVPPTMSPAPENSEGMITMLPDGTINEVRVFRSHPKISRVDTYFTRPGMKRVKIVLRDGRVVELETDRIDNLLSISSGELLQIAGIK